MVLVLAVAMTAQEQQPSVTKDGMKVQINVINVCTPAPEEQQAIAAALSKLPRAARFAPDFEVSRGRTTLPDAPVSRWVRIRREFLPESPYINVQYSFSADDQNLIETLVFRLRDPREVLLVSIEDNVSAAAATPATLLASDTPATRIKVERFGKNSLGLSRCPNADQAAYQPLFNRASEVLAAFRQALGVRRAVPAELARVGAPAPPKQP